MKTTFNVIAISGSSLRNLVDGIVSDNSFRGYTEPTSSILEVDEEVKKVSYNGNTYDFVEYRSGIHGFARIVAFNIHGILVEAYTDTPARSDKTREDIMEAFERRKADRYSNY